jgi:hypothetical protein
MNTTKFWSKPTAKDPTATIERWHRTILPSSEKKKKKRKISIKTCGKRSYGRDQTATTPIQPVNPNQQVNSTGD